MPPESLTSVFFQWGLSGVVLLCAGWWIWMKDKQNNAMLKSKSELHTKEIVDMQNIHRDERAELTTALQKQHEEALSVSRDVTDVLRQNTQAFTELSTLIRDRK